MTLRTPLSSSPRGPGLAKARVSLVREKSTWSVSVDAKQLTLWLFHADIVSEGGVREEHDGPTWFGSTSFIAHSDEHDPDLLLRVLARDLHTRTRVTRVALREASLRSPFPLGRANCEIRFDRAGSRLSIDVDIQALLVGATCARTTTRK